MTTLDGSPQEAIILVAGVGSRLGERTGGGPKCLVPVAGASILDRQVAALRNAGVRRLVVVTGHASERVRQVLTELAGDLEVDFVHNPLYGETNVLYSWSLGSERLRGSHYYLHGDTVFEPDLLVRLREHGSCPVVLSIDRHECGDEEMKVRATMGKILEISKTMVPEDALGEFTGVMRVDAGVLSDLRRHAMALLKDERGRRLFFEAVIQRLIDAEPERVGWVDITGLRWREVDFPEDLDAAERLFADAGA